MSQYDKKSSRKDGLLQRTVGIQCYKLDMLGFFYHVYDIDVKMFLTKALNFVRFYVKVRFLS